MSMVLSMFMILMSSGWFTLMERKTLSYTQMRVGPNKISKMGMFMPIADFIKLAHKDSFVNMNNSLLYSMYIKMFISLVLLSFCKQYNFMSNQYMMFYLMLVSSLMGYAILLPSLSTKSLYSVLGMIRMFSMILSFEISLFLMIIMMNLMNMSNKIDLSMLILPCMSIFCIFTFIMEMNRHPFEVIEGESELVSGFNVELSSLMFTVYFLSEMINITIMTIVMCVIHKSISLYWMLIILILLARSSYPRMRYDYIMMLQWTGVYLMIISLMYMC